MELDIGKIIGDSYGMLFKNGTVLRIGIILAVISALLGVVVNIVEAPLVVALRTSTSLSDMSTIMATVISVIAITIVISFAVGLVSIFFSGALLSAASSGDKADLGASFAKAKSRYFSLLGASIICGFIALASMLPGAAIIMTALLLSGVAFGVLVILGGVLLMAIVIYITLRLWVVDAVCVVGGYGAVESVKRSWNLTKGNLWGIFAVLLLMGLISGITGGIFGEVLKYLISMVSPTVGTFVGGFVEAIIAIPISVAMALAYVQLAGPVKKARPVKAQARKSLK